MESVTVSSNYQIEIPPKIRESLKIKPGQKLQIIQYLDRIEIISLKPITEMKGIFKGINTNFVRENEV